MTSKFKLTFWRQYTYSDGYGLGNSFVKENINIILNKFKTSSDIEDILSIESIFNDIYYPFFDLDSLEKYNLFKKIYSSTPYVIFKSSTDKYWGFIDVGTKNKKDIYFDVNWKVCNDDRYVNFSRRYDRLYIRGLYQNSDRKPFLFEINEKKMSDNFKSFMENLDNYYNKEGLELSVLRYKDPLLLIKFNRKRKLEEIKKLK